MLIKQNYVNNVMGRIYLQCHESLLIPVLILIYCSYIYGLIIDVFPRSVAVDNQSFDVDYFSTGFFDVFSCSTFSCSTFSRRR
jgi:hypothetical protein